MSCKYNNCKHCGYKLECEIFKENAELKEKYDTCLRENTGLKIHSAYIEKKLTEAKEIIRELIGIINYLNEDEYGKEDFPIVHKAEAFLNKE